MGTPEVHNEMFAIKNLNEAYSIKAQEADALRDSPRYFYYFVQIWRGKLSGVLLVR